MGILPFYIDKKRVSPLFLYVRLYLEGSAWKGDFAQNIMLFARMVGGNVDIEPVT